MTSYTPEMFKQTIDNYETYDDFCNGNLDAQSTTIEINKHSHWLIYLIIKERLDDIRDFLSQITNEYRVQLVNLQTVNGNILHEICYWCNNNNTIDLFRIFISSGALIVRNNLNLLPNELVNTLWIYNGYIIRIRNPSDFNFINTEIYNRFIN